jgi:hypothetical protein
MLDVDGTSELELSLKGLTRGHVTALLDPRNIVAHAMTASPSPKKLRPRRVGKETANIRVYRSHQSLIRSWSPLHLTIEPPSTADLREMVSRSLNMGKNLYLTSYNGTYRILILRLLIP